jgi:nuclear pore complex protein Nup205
MTDNPNISLVQCLESAVVEFHQRRRHLVDSLRYLFEAATAATSTESPPIYVRLDAFIRQNFIPESNVSTGEPSLASRILDEIEKLDSVISKALDARQNATSSSCSDGMLISSLQHEQLVIDR